MSLHGVSTDLIFQAGSGMGLQVAKLLAERGEWSLHLFDVNAIAGEEAEKSLGSISHFHQVNVTSYNQLATTFDMVFQSEGRLDFVYANAGIKESDDIYKVHDGPGPPPEPNQGVIDLNLKSVVNTCYLASHYFRLSPQRGIDANVVITASAGSLYALDSAPMYAGGKFGALGFMWSIAKVFKRKWGIRVNAVLPGPVPTNLLPGVAWEEFFDHRYLTPVIEVAKVVVQFADSVAMTDSAGVKYEAEEVFGRAAEVITTEFFFREQQDYCNEGMKAVMAGNDL